MRHLVTTPKDENHSCSKDALLTCNISTFQNALYWYLIFFTTSFNKTLLNCKLKEFIFFFYTELSSNFCT